MGRCSGNDPHPGLFIRVIQLSHPLHLIITLVERLKQSLQGLTGAQGRTPHIVLRGHAPTQHPVAQPHSILFARWGEYPLEIRPIAEPEFGFGMPEQV